MITDHDATTTSFQWAQYAIFMFLFLIQCKKSFAKNNVYDEDEAIKYVERSLFEFSSCFVL